VRAVLLVLILLLCVVLLAVGPDLGAYVQAFGRCGCPYGSVLLVVLVWVWRVVLLLVLLVALVVMVMLVRSRGGACTRE